jgi:hypothetical protein
MPPNMASPEARKRQKRQRQNRKKKNTIKHHPFCTETRVSFSRSLRLFLSTVGDRKTKHRSGFPPGQENLFDKVGMEKQKKLFWVSFSTGAAHQKQHTRTNTTDHLPGQTFSSPLLLRRRGLSVSVPSRSFSQAFPGPQRTQRLCRRA